MNAKSLFVVGDVHGQYDTLVGLLKKANVIDDELVKNPDVRCVHVGDLLDARLGSGVGDKACLDDAEFFFDKVLIGNHEHPYLDGPAFTGFYRDYQLAARVRTLVEKGFYTPAYLEGDILITHAGVSQEWDFSTAEEAYGEIMKRWREDPLAGIFSAIGHGRGGRCRFGGIFWSDFEREKKNKNFSQIMGHTILPKGPIKYERPSNNTFTMGIDVGGKLGKRLVGVWIRDGHLAETVEYTS